MPITPFDAPISFQYKPLGLEQFAKPLSKMQDQYDLTSSKIDESKYNINALDADKETRDKIEKELNLKRDELAANLLKTGNYREAHRKLVELNKAYQEHPEIQALNSEHAATMKYIKEGDERALKGDINKEAWNNHKQNILAEYKVKGGLGYKPEDKNYTSVRREHLGEDREKELHDRLLEVGRATPEQMKDIATKHGFDLSTYQIYTSDGKINYKELEHIKKNMKEDILNQPRFSQYLNEIAGIDAEKQQFRNVENHPEWMKEQYATVAKRYNDRINNVEALAKKKDPAAVAYLKSPEYQKDLQDRNEIVKQMESGEMKPEVAKKIYQQNYTSNYIDKSAQSAADIFDYRRQDIDKKWTNMSKDQLGLFGLGEKVPVIPEAGLVKTGQSPTVSGLDIHKTITTNRTNIDSQITKVNDIGKMPGTNRGYFDVLYPNKSDKGGYNRLEQSNYLTKINKANLNSKSPEEFLTKLRDYGVPTDGKEKELKDWYKVLSTENGRINLNKSAYVVKKESEQLNAAKLQYKNLEEKSKNSKEINEFLNDQKEVFVMDILNDQRTDKEGRSLPSIGDRLKIYNQTDLDNYIKRKTDYKDFHDAVKNNFNFGKIGLGEISGNLQRDYQKEMYNQIKDKDYTANEADFYVIGDDKNAKNLRNEMTGLISSSIKNGNVEGMVPQYGETWNEQPGFDEEGKFVGKLDPKSFRFTTSADGQVYGSVEAIVDKDSDAKGGTVKFKISDPVLKSKMITTALKSQVVQDDELSKRNAQMLHVSNFDTKHPLSPGFQESSKRLDPKAGEFIPVDVPLETNIGNGGVKLRIVKTGMTGKAGENNYKYGVQGLTDNGWKTIPSSMAPTIDEVKIWIDKQETGL